MSVVRTLLILYGVMKAAGGFVGQVWYRKCLSCLKTRHTKVAMWVKKNINSE